MIELFINRKSPKPSTLFFFFSKNCYKEGYRIGEKGAVKKTEAESNPHGREKTRRISSPLDHQTIEKRRGVCYYFFPNFSFCAHVSVWKSGAIVIGVCVCVCVCIADKNRNGGYGFLLLHPFGPLYAIKFRNTRGSKQIHRSNYSSSSQLESKKIINIVCFCLLWGWGGARLKKLKTFFNLLFLGRDKMKDSSFWREKKFDSQDRCDLCEHAQKKKKKAIKRNEERKKKVLF